MDDLRKWIKLIESSGAEIAPRAGLPHAGQEVVGHAEQPYSTMRNLSRIPADLSDEDAIEAMEKGMRATGLMTSRIYQIFTTMWKEALKQPDCDRNAEAGALQVVTGKYAGSGPQHIMLALRAQRPETTSYYDLALLYLEAMKRASTPEIDGTPGKPIRDERRG